MLLTGKWSSGMSEFWIGLHVIFGGVLEWVTGSHKGWEMDMNNLPGHVR